MFSSKRQDLFQILLLHKESSKGSHKVKVKASLEVARNAILEGFDDATIAKLPGLRPEEIKKLREEMDR